MVKVLILHGWHGSDLPHWQAWLAQALVLEDCIVAFPKLSDNASPNKDIWLNQAREIIEDFRPDIVIAHSLANILWFHLAGSISYTVKKLLLCAPPRDLSDYDEVKSFFPSPIPTSLSAAYSLLLVSDNDPYISIDEANLLASKLNIPLEIIHNAGHINADSGFGEWPWVKEWILK